MNDVFPLKKSTALSTHVILSRFLPRIGTIFSFFLDTKVLIEMESVQ